MRQGSILLVGEDALCCALGAALIAQAGVAVALSATIKTGGANRFRDEIPRMNNAANHFPVLMVADADQAPCVVTQVRSWLPPRKSHNLLLRLAVREAESWVLADSAAFAAFAAVSPAKVPRRPDELEDPKRFLLNLVTKSKRRDLKAEMLPRNSRSSIGLGYNLHLETFVRDHWSAARAAEQSPSLARALPRVRALLQAGGDSR